MPVKMHWRVKEKLKDRDWTLSHLYRIVDKNKKSIPFRPNWMQRELFACQGKRIISLKARQLGSTTGWCIYFLNKALFQSNQSLGILSYNQDAARDILGNIIGHGIETLPPAIKAMPQCQIVKKSAREIAFANGSSIKVDTTLRGGTLSGLLVTELGKICARYPDKAKEIKTGSVQTVPDNGLLVIESTAEGATGYFHDLCMGAYNRPPETPLDFHFFFFPWYRHPDYVEALPPTKAFPQIMVDYFEELEAEHEIGLYPAQKAWYTRKFLELGEEVKQEYPSTPNEAFMVSNEGYWYLLEMANARASGQIGRVPYNPMLEVHTAWDIGYNDPAAIWFFQILRNGNVHFIDYYESNRAKLEHFVKEIKSREYNYGIHWLPHDADKHEFGTGMSIHHQAMQMGLKNAITLRRYNPSKSSLVQEIQRARNVLARSYFNGQKCARGIECLQNYRKKWNQAMGMYSSEAVHDWASHGSDAFRYACQAVEFGAEEQEDALTQEKAKVRRAMRSRV